MAIRAKTKRRLVIVLVGSVVITGSAVAFYAVRKQQIRKRHLEWRAEGIAAVEAGDYPTALESLGRYLNRTFYDVEALYAYSQARRNVVEEKGKHLVDTIRILHRVVQLDQENKRARRDLLDLYLKAGLSAEALRAAESFLDVNDTDTEALHAKVVALRRLRRFEAALPVSWKYNRLKPEDLGGQVMTLQILHALEEPDEGMILHVDALRMANPDIPRFQLLTAIAYSMIQDDELAKEWCRIAAKGEPVGPQFTRHLVSMLDKLGLDEESNVVLERDVSFGGDIELQRLLIRRLWQNNRLMEVIDRLAKLDPSDDGSDSELLAMKAMTHLQLDRANEAAPLIAALRTRTQDKSARAWRVVLDEVIAKPNVQGQVAVEVCRRALAILPNHPFIHFFLGRAYASAGEADLALKSWARAAELVPAWQEPHLASIRTLLELGRIEQGMSLALAAQKRWPTSVAIAAALSVAWAANVQAGRTVTGDDLLKLVNQVQEAQPGELQTLPIQIGLVARTGAADEARQMLERALGDEWSLSERTLLKLALVSQANGLDLEEACLRRSEELFGLSPALAFARGMRLAADGRQEEGFVLLRKAGGTGGNEIGWSLVRARYLEQTNDDRAKDAWIELAEAAPENLRIQKLAVQADSTQGDHGFIERVLGRLRELGGQQSLEWRMAKARWLLRKDLGKETAIEAAELLESVAEEFSHLIELHLMLADCEARRGDISAALAQLASAARIDPGSKVIAIEQAQLMQRQGDFASAKAILNQAIKSGGLTIDQKRRVASLLAAQGEAGRAVEILEQTVESGDVVPDLMLASLYWRRSDLKSAEAICERLLEAPDAEIIQFATHLYASTGRVEEAQAVLARLDELDLGAGIVALLKANFAGRYLTQDEATGHYQAALAVDPNNPTCYLAFAGYLLAANRVDEAVDTVVKGSQQLPDDANLQFLRQHVDLIRLADSHELSRSLVYSLVSQVKDRSAAVDALTVFRDAMANDSPADEVIIELRQLADQYRRSLPVQMATARLYLALKRHDDAAYIARRSMQSFPTSVNPAVLGSEALGAGGRWVEALSVAQEWRKKVPHQPVNADLLIAESLLRLGDAKGAAEQTQRYLLEALANPSVAHPLIISHARALLADGKREAAAELLSPLLEASKDWRKAWIWLGLYGIGDSDMVAQWLEKVRPLLAERDEQLLLAQAWQSLALNSDDPAHLQMAFEMIKPVVDAEEAPAQALMTMAIIEESNGNIDQAQYWYRRALEQDPQLVVAKNNLASLLANLGQNLDEAAELAANTVQAYPKVANFYDTLAFVEAKRGNGDAAIKSMRTAVELDRENVIWHINLALVVSDYGDPEEFKTMADTIAVHDLDDVDIPSSIRQRWEALIAKMAEIAEAKAKQAAVEAAAVD